MSPTSSTSSRSRSRSPSQTSSSIFHLPPSLPATSSQFYESDLPSPLTDSLLHPPTRPDNQRKNSWKQLLTSGVPTVDDRWDNENATERTNLLGNHTSRNDERESNDGHETMPSSTSSRAHRTRSQSKSARLQLPWYRRPSPIWLLVRLLSLSVPFLGISLADKPPFVDFCSQERS